MTAIAGRPEVSQQGACISPLLGAIAGDVIGSPYKHHPIKFEEFALISAESTFTDDSVLSLAIAHALLRNRAYAASVRRLSDQYPDAGYGGMFRQWMRDANAGPYHSFGNGSAMRVSAVAMAFSDERDVLEEAGRSAAITHDHPEGIKGAQATALAIFLALNGAAKDNIRDRLQREFDYDLGRSLTEIRRSYVFDISCQGSVPESIMAFLESTSVEDAIRTAISLGGDADTMACIAGSIAAAFYQRAPLTLIDAVRSRLPAELIRIVDAFEARFGVSQRE